MRRSGITLVEAMLAILILGMVATMVWSGFDQTARNKAAVERGLDHHHVIRIALERMSRELSMAYVSAQKNTSPALITMDTAFVGTDRGDDDRLDFTSFSHQRLYRDAHESDQNEISYFVTRHPEDASIQVLARREQNRIDEDPRRGGHIEILVGPTLVGRDLARTRRREGPVVMNVEKFDLEYLDPLSGEWLRSWDTTQASGQPNRLPAQVKIMLTVPHPRTGRPLTYGTRAAINITHAVNHSIYNPR